jgi:D-alanine-D-alanine ligase
VKALTKAIYTILGGSGIMRVDYIITQKEGQDVINLLEINATPGMTQTSFIPQQARADGLEMKDILTEIIEGKLKS